MDQPGEKINGGKFVPRFWSRLWSKLDESIVSLTARAFLFAFLPVCVALIASLLATQKAVQEGITEEVRESSRQFEKYLRGQDAHETQEGTWLLTMLVENSELEKVMGALRIDPANQQLRRQAQDTVVPHWDQLKRLHHYDLLIITDSLGQPLISQVIEEQPVALESVSIPLPLRGTYCNRCHTTPALLVGGVLYDAETAPIQGTSGILGSITIGKKFNIHSLTPLSDAVVESNGKILLNTFPAGLVSEVGRELQKSCPWGKLECEVEIGGETYHVLRVRRANMWGSYRLLTFHPLNQGKEQFLQPFNRLFYKIGAGSLILVLVFSAIASYFMARPIANLVAHLRQSERTGQFSPDFPTHSMTKEVNLLARSLNGAARAVQQSQEQLIRADLESLEAMAETLDARDHYTAGHSDRVSANSVAIAQAMGVPHNQVEIIRIGAKLHDIGKIGIADAILQKPGRLTPEEFLAIQHHPQIGKKILQKVGRFQDYLPLVELHHENYDGSGYPYGLKGEEIPRSVRIVHVADVYDALTSERSYRKAMLDQEAEQMLVKGAGKEFDPSVVETFLSILHQRRTLDQMLEEAADVRVAWEKCPSPG